MAFRASIRIRLAASGDILGILFLGSIFLFIHFSYFPALVSYFPALVLRRLELSFAEDSFGGLCRSSSQRVLGEVLASSPTRGIRVEAPIRGQTSRILFPLPIPPSPPFPLAAGLLGPDMFVICW
jgi:hypothetical protein